MKIVHSLTLISISIFVGKLVRSKKVLSKKQYWQMFCVLTLACVVYFAPVVYILYLTYTDNVQLPKDSIHDVAFMKFARYVHMMLNKLDFSGWGFFISYAIHL